MKPIRGARGSTVLSWKKVCVDVAEPTVDGPVLGAALDLDWQPDEQGEGGLRDRDSRWIVWVNRVPDAPRKSDRVRLEAAAAAPHPVRLVVESETPERLARWWAARFDVTARCADDTGWEVPDVHGLPVRWRFVPQAGAKDRANRVHWDVAVAAAALPALLADGARLLRPLGEDRDWHVLADPEGNEFCAFPVE